MDEFLIPIEEQKPKIKPLEKSEEKTKENLKPDEKANISDEKPLNKFTPNNVKPEEANKALNSSLTSYDKYLLDKYGQGLNVKTKQDIEFKSRSINEPIKRLTTLNKALAASDEVLKYHEEAGLAQGASKKLNDLTGGIWELDEKGAKYDNALRNFIDISGQALARGGNNSNKAQEEQRKNLGGAFTSKEGVKNRLMQQRQTLLKYMDDELKGLETLGFKVKNDTSLMQNYIKQRKKQDYLENTDKFDYEEYESAFSKFAKKKSEEKELLRHKND